MEGGARGYGFKKLSAKSLESFSGLLEGILSDGIVKHSESMAIREWHARHLRYKSIKPFSTILKAIDNILADGIIENEELEDLNWQCKSYLKEGTAWDKITSDIQHLHGLLAGIACDIEIKEVELKKLKDWLFDHDSLQGTWPYDELLSLTINVFQNRALTQQEKDIIHYYFNEFLGGTDFRSIVLPLNEVNIPITAVYGVCPEVKLGGSVVCFTGNSSKYVRRELGEFVIKAGGEFADIITLKTNYLIVCDKVSPYWAFEAYGRKVEQAIKLRKSGSSIVIAHEADFIEAVRSAKVFD